MDRINPESTTGAIPKGAFPQVQKETHKENFSKQVRKVESAIARTATPTAGLKCSDNTRALLSASVQSDSMYGQALAICIRSIVEVACDRQHVSASIANPTAAGRTADRVQKQAAHAKSAATPSPDRNRQSHATTPVMAAPSTGDTSLDKSISDMADYEIRLNIKRHEQHYDLGKKRERIADYHALLYRRYVWLWKVNAARVEANLPEENSSETWDEKEKRWSKSTFDCFSTLDVFYRDSSRDKEFVQIIENFASFVRVNEADKMEINELAKVFAFHCKKVKKKLEDGENREMVDKLFSLLMKDMLSDYPNLLVTFGMQCKFVCELRNNNFDMIDRFRKYVMTDIRGALL